MYGYVVAKFSRMGRLPHFFSYGAPPTRGAEAPLKSFILLPQIERKRSEAYSVINLAVERKL